MPAFNIAWRTRRGLASHREMFDLFGEPPTRIILARLSASPEDLYDRHQALTQAGTAPGLTLRALQPEAHLCAALDVSTLTLTCAATGEVLHYFRLADATLRPLPETPGPLTFSPGDAYIALTPGARRVADSPAIARFLHMRDDFNAEKLADALLDHLVELVGGDVWPESITAVVVEAK